MLFTEMKVFGQEQAQQALPIVGLCVFFFAFTAGELLLSRRLHRTGKNLLTTYYMAMKVVRMLLSILLFVAYYLAGGANIPAFGINLLILYTATMAYSTVCHVRMEKRS